MAKRNKFIGGHSQLRELAVRGVILVALIAGQPFLWRVVANAAEDLHQKRSQQEQIQEVQTRIEQIQQAKESQKELVDQLRVVIPDEDTLLAVIERLQLMAGLDQHNIALTLQNIEREQVNEEETVPSPVLPFRINVVATGKISNLLAYLHRVEHLQELTVVRDVSFVPVSGGGRPIVQTPPQVGSPSSPLPAATPLPAALTEPTYTMTLSIVFFFQPLDDATKK